MTTKIFNLLLTAPWYLIFIGLAFSSLWNCLLLVQKPIPQTDEIKSMVFTQHGIFYGVCWSLTRIFLMPFLTTLPLVALTLDLLAHIECASQSVATTQKTLYSFRKKAFLQLFFLL